jgi:hypothetical protein
LWNEIIGSAIFPTLVFPFGFNPKPTTSDLDYRGNADLAKVSGIFGNPWLLILLVLIGGLIGSALESSFAGTVPFFGEPAWVGFGPATLNLKYLNLTFGFSMAVGPLTVVGFIVGYFAYRWL